MKTYHLRKGSERIEFEELNLKQVGITQGRETVTVTRAIARALYDEALAEGYQPVPLWGVPSLGGKA